MIFMCKKLKMFEKLKTFRELYWLLVYTVLDICPFAIWYNGYFHTFTKRCWYALDSTSHKIFPFIYYIKETPTEYIFKTFLVSHRVEKQSKTYTCKGKPFFHKTYSPDAIKVRKIPKFGSPAEKTSTRLN